METWTNVLELERCDKTHTHANKETRVIAVDTAAQYA